MTVTDMNAYRGGRRRIGSILVTVGLVMAGCASSGDVEQVRQERAQAKAKMSAELQQERTLAQSMEQESEARKAEADKLAKALGGGAAGASGAAARPRMGASLSAMSLTTALANASCKLNVPANPPNPAVTVLYVDGTTPCSNVTVSAADATFTASAPLMPVIVGLGGTLTLQDQAMTLYASSFLIRNGGTMQAGTATAPIQSQITIVMAGKTSAALAPQAFGSSAIVTTSNSAPNARDITVMDGGALKLYGAKGQSAAPGTLNKDIVSGTKSWTYLAVPAGPAQYNDAENVSAPVPATNPDTTLTLATTVDWQVNDWISVATTSFTSHQTETVKICGIQSVANPDPQASTLGLPANVSQFTLCQKLKHYHYGGAVPTPGFFPAGTKQVVAPGGNAIDVGRQAKSLYDGPDRNYGIDERAEVALLSRNIKLTSVAGSAGDQTLLGNSYTGGHLVAMASGTTNPSLTLVGVEIEKFGQPFVGRYSVHLHMLPNGNNVLVQDVSVHHSYNKCYVPHQTPNAKFYNNVCVRTVGQGFYLEDGTNITGNQFMRNHIAGVMAANSTYSYPRQNNSTYWDGDNLQQANTSATWYTINSFPDTSFSNNNTIGAYNIGPDLFVPGGFWVTNLGNTFVNNSVAGCQAQGRGYWIMAQDSNQIYAYPEFAGNRVHGCYHGIDTQPDMVNTLDPKPTMNGTINDHAPLLLLNDNTVTRSRSRGFWGRGIFVTLHNNRFATNPFGFTLLGGGGPEGNVPGFWGMAYENVIAGMTRNNVERYAGGCHFRITNAQSTSGPPNYTPVTSGGAVYTVITTPNAPPTGTQVQISGVQGTINANGSWTTVTNISATQFALPSPFNYGTYTGGGVWQYYPPSTAPSLITECTDVALYSGNTATFGKYPSTTMNMQGYSYYDGPARIEHNRFVNFRFDPTGIHSTNPAARLLTQTDIAIIGAKGKQGQLTNPSGVVPAANSASAASYQGYAGDPATGWQQANAQSVPPTQYIQDSIWDNVDFKHQVYTEAVNMGPFSDGDKTTVILDKDSQLTGLRAVDGRGVSHHDIVPVSLNSVDYYATDFTVDEPHSRGTNDFRSTSLMSPHKYATLNIESPNPVQKLVEIKRDMPAYNDTNYPGLFFYGRGGNPIYEPFVMDRMGYTVYANTTGSQEHGARTPTSFESKLLFSYTDPAVKKAGDYFVARIAVYQAVSTPANIAVYRIRRQWGQQYTNLWPPHYTPPRGNSCDNAFLAGGNWQDCLNRANNLSPYNVAPYTNLGPYGKTLSPAADWTSFEKNYKDLLAGTITVANFIANQTYYYDSTNSLLYFYMIEDAPVQRGYAPYGTCNAAKYSDYVKQIQGIKAFSDPNSVQAALDASCLVSGGTPQYNDLFSCNEIGCAAYLVDFSTAGVSAPPAPPATPSHPISRTDYKGWNQYTLVYGTFKQQPNGLPVVANPAIGNTAPPPDGQPLTGAMTPTDGTAPPTGDQVTYNFYGQGGVVPNVTENFRYRCVTTPPWAPVNARGAYPPTGGFTYPLAPNVCTNH